ncbi:MAG: hypothetical protein QMD65_00955 [Patescibacteria group bacterium]|nr:hypothetical protein [Patescibacteria group bacterium]
MFKQKRFREKIGGKTIIIGLSGIAVLLAFADAAAKTFLSFPDHRTSIGHVWKNLRRYPSKSVREYFEELKEISGVNLRNILYRLERKGLVRKTGDGYVATSLGGEVAENVKDLIEKSALWDGRWRLITFDVPEKSRRDRDWLRDILRLYDYKSLHKSVFLGKIPLPEKIYREIYERKMSSYIRLLTVGEIDEDELT